MNRTLESSDASTEVWVLTDDDGNIIGRDFVNLDFAAPADVAQFDPAPVQSQITEIVTETQSQVPSQRTLEQRIDALEQVVAALATQLGGG